MTAQLPATINYAAQVASELHDLAPDLFAVVWRDAEVQAYVRRRSESEPLPPVYFAARKCLQIVGYCIEEFAPADFTVRLREHVEALAGETPGVWDLLCDEYKLPHWEQEDWMHPRIEAETYKAVALAREHAAERRDERREYMHRCTSSTTTEAARPLATLAPPATVFAAQ